MADTSPGSKVQALRAMFAQKHEPVMGMMPPGGKMGARPWKRTPLATQEDNIQSKPTLENEQIIKFQLPIENATFPSESLKIFSSAIKSNPNFKDIKNGDTKTDTNSRVCDNPVKLCLKPCVGPKPMLPLLPNKTASISSLHAFHSPTASNNQHVNGNFPKTSSENLDSTSASKNECSFTNSDKSRTMGETIASFMFVSDSACTRENDSQNSYNGSNCDEIQLPVPNPRKLGNDLNSSSNTEVWNNCNTQNMALLKSDVNDSCTNLITTDNYICKSNCKFRRKELPSKEKLGPAPLKPFRPHHMKLPDVWSKRPSPNSLVIPQIHLSKTGKMPMPLPPQKPVPPTPQRPTYPCPPRPAAPPPQLPLTSQPSSVLSCHTNVELRTERGNVSTEEMEELYEDTMVDDKAGRPISLIPEYTEEEERAGSDIEDFYDDAGEDITATLTSQSPVKPKMPPPPPPPSSLAGTLGTSFNDSSEELYQDAIDINQEEFYEVMPVDLPQEDPGAPLYSNNKKEFEKLRREEEKRVRREQKLREKREKEQEKVRRKFGLTGEEIPIDAGLVKSDCRGSRNDLPVKRGETVLILRMEGNPSGKWLVKNERGKIGYVELTNIEVDPDSVKSDVADESADLSDDTEKGLTWLSKFTSCVR